MSLTLNDLRVVRGEVHNCSNTDRHEGCNRHDWYDQATDADVIEILPTIGAEQITTYMRMIPIAEPGTYLVLKVDR